MIRKLATAVRIAFSRESSDAMVRLAQRALRKPESLTPQQVKSLAASVLSQSGGRKPIRDEGDSL